MSLSFHLKRRVRQAGLGALSALFVSAGGLHFARPRLFEAIVPPSLPAPRTLVFVSGAAEILFGLGVLPRPTRRAAGWALAGLLVAVFPANLYMALDDEHFGAIPAWARWGRLPMQPLLIAWVLWATQSPPPETS